MEEASGAQPIAGESAAVDHPDSGVAPETAASHAAAPTPVGAAAADAGSEAVATFRQWEEYFKAVPAGRGRWARIQQLRAEMEALPPQEATALLQLWLQAGIDLPTGVRMQVGPGGQILGAASLRAAVLDWLGTFDPIAAAALGRARLAAGTEGIDPDSWVIHLRNLAQRANDPTSLDRVRAAFLELTHQNAWMEVPGAAVAEAMDVAVFLKDSGLVPTLAQLSAPAAHPVLQHAASLALERLMDAQPLDSARALLESKEGQAMDPRLRASLLARVNPANAEAKALLTDYLASARPGSTETTGFLAAFPNLNQSLSHNLLSAGHDTVTTINSAAHLQRALTMVRAWRANPLLAGHAQTLRETEARLLFQLTGQPGS